METTDSDQQKEEEKGGGRWREGEREWGEARKEGMETEEKRKKSKGERTEGGGWSKHWCRMNAIFSFSPSPHLPPVLLLLWAEEQEALHHPDRRRKRREGERKRDCDGGIKGYPSLSVTSFIVPCSVLPAHPSSAVTHTHTRRHFPPIFTHSKTTTANTHTHQRRAVRHTNWLTLRPVSHIHCNDAHTHTLRSVSHTQTHTFTATRTQTHTHKHTLTNLRLGSPPCFTVMTHKLRLVSHTERRRTHKRTPEFLT